jgi:L-threonylcarbamoyladenylate synthase
MEIMSVPDGTTPLDRFDDLGDRLRRGAILLLPTDTLYGLSANALDAAAVDRTAALKQRRSPATIIPHDLAWAASLVEERYRASAADMLADAGGDTLLFRYAPAPGVAVPAPSLVDSGLVALRVPRHWIASLAQRQGVPLITTSANVTGGPPMTSVDDLDPRVAAGVELCVSQGTCAGRPSALIYCDGAAPRRVERR